MQMHQTTMNINDRIENQWYLIDAADLILGRLATQVAILLRGKDKVYFNPAVDCGANVIIINASKIKLTGKKLTNKKYYNHSQYPGGLRTRTAQNLIAKNAAEIIEKAIRGMLPHNSLGRKQFTHLHVYNGMNHPHQAQNPQVLKIVTEK